MPRIIVHTRAARYIERMDARIKAQLKSKLAELARNPDKMPGIKPMAGEWAGFHQMRHGDLRIIFMRDRINDTLIIAHIGPRGDAYK